LIAPQKFLVVDDEIRLMGKLLQEILEDEGFVASSPKRRWRARNATQTRLQSSSCSTFWMPTPMA
jgi:DNA-binding response OmpR family regulator